MTFEFIRCLACRKTWDMPAGRTADAHAAIREIIDTHRANFPKHRIGFAAVHGTKTDGIDCRGKCTTAVSGDCECACGGVNHGRFAVA